MRNEISATAGTNKTNGNAGAALAGWSIGDQMRGQRAAQARVRLESEVRSLARGMGADLRLAGELAERSRVVFEVVNGEAVVATRKENGTDGTQGTDGAHKADAVGNWVRGELTKAGVISWKEAATLGPSPVKLPRAQKNPWRKSSWNLTEQMRIGRRDPELAARLSAEAEVNR